MRLPPVQSWSRWVLPLSLIFNGFFAGAYVFGEIRARGGVHHGDPGATLCDRLHLDASQKRAMEESYRRLSVQMEPLQREMAGRRERLVGYMGSATPDSEAVFREVDAIGGLQAKAQRLLVGHMMERMQSLNADQRVLFHRMLRERFCSNPLCGAGMGREPSERGCPVGEHRER